MVSARELSDMTPEEMKTKAHRLYQVVHSIPEIRTVLIPEHKFIFQDWFDSQERELILTMKALVEALSTSAHEFILGRVFSWETNTSEKQKFLFTVDYMLEVAKVLTDISPDFNVSFDDVTKILSKYPNTPEFAQMLGKLSEYTTESQQKRKTLHDAIDAAAEAAEEIMKPKEKKEIDEFRYDWDQLLTFVYLKDIDTITRIQSRIPNYTSISQESTHVTPNDIQILLQFVTEYIVQTPLKVLEIVIQEDVSEAVEYFDEHSSVKFKDLLAQWFSEKSV